MSSANDWLDSLAAAWRAERLAARAKVAMERSGRTLVERVALGIALEHLRIVDEMSAPGDRDRVRVRLTVPERIDLDNLRIAPGEPVRLWAEHPDEAGAVRGVFERREGQSLWLMLDRPVEALDRDYALDPEAPELTFDRGDAAIERTKAALANTDLARMREVAGLARPAKLLAAVTWTPLDDELDERQLEAVDTGLRSGDIALIWGPPGTGKTRTLVEVVRQRVARGERVLCTAPSNTAVDNLGIRLADAGIRVVRLGHPARVSPALASLTVEAQVEADGAFDLAREWRDRARAIRKQAMGTDVRKGTREQSQAARAEVRGMWQEARQLDRDAAREIHNAERLTLDRAHVVLATCVGCDHPMLGDAVFDCVVIDEATQAPDPLLLIPLARARVAVLAGDPQQLGPVVIGGPNLDAVLGSTIFDRLIDPASRSESGPLHFGAEAPSVMLEQQHRMHEQIMAFPSTTTYDGKLRASPAVAGHRLEDIGVAPDPARDKPLWLVDTAGKDWLEGRTDFDPGGSLNYLSHNNMPSFSFDPSTFNSGNAERVAAEARRVLSRGLPATELAIIAAYSAQARRLRDLLREERAQGLEIGTVDGFQGREKEAVIVDLVRSNDHGELGFLSNTRRMNVALTRARRFLLVVADSATLGDHPYYASLIRYIDSIDGHGSAWSDEAEALK